MAYLVKKYSEGKWIEFDDLIAEEDPLQITLDGHPVAVVMRTLGSDLDLVHGFLKTEGILQSVDQISRVDIESKENHALVFLADDVEIDLSFLQRNLYSASSCGICGKASIEAICLKTPVVKKALDLLPEVILAAPTKLREYQEMFDKTGGIHAAGLFNADGDLLVLREDVGRHNAVDKVIGWAWREGVDMSQCFLQVSGRVSFEVMQKALMAHISVVSAISAPSSLAIDFAKEAGMILYGFVRENRFNQYS